VNGDFFDTLSAQDKQLVAETTDTLVEMLRGWTAQYPGIRPSRIPTVALSTALVLATAVPRIPCVNCLTLPKLALWTFGVDDVTDERLLPLAKAQRKAEEWCLIASHGSSDPIKDETDENDELTAILLEVRDELSEFRLFEPLHKHWAYGMRILLEGILQEYRHGLDYSARGARALPSLEEYLRYSLGSIGVILWSLTVFIILSDPATMENFESISQVLWNASVAIRLYNDLQTYDKEVEEDNVNSVVITHFELLNRNPSASAESLLDEAKRHVRQLANSYVQRSFNLTRQIRTDGGQVERILHDTVAFHVDFYDELDYHTASLVEIDEMLEGRLNQDVIVPQSFSGEV
jgi:hypothetical protein